MLELNEGVKMISIDVPGLMMIFATAIMAYLIICFIMGIVASIYIHFRYLFHPESIEPYLRVVALHNPQKYREYIEYFGINDEKSNSAVIVPFTANNSMTNYVGED